ncbi:MAG: glycosyltransferase [Sphingomonadaceae bacterium]
MNEAPTVAVVIVNYRTPALALRCLAALVPERNALPSLRVIIVDGGSGDGSADVLAAGIDNPDFHDWVTLLPLPINGGFGWANNQAIITLLQSQSPPDFIHLLNPDTEIEPGAVAILSAILDEHPRVAAVGSQLVEPDGRNSGSAFRFPSAGREFMRASRTPSLCALLGIKPTLIERETAGVAEWVTGASVMFRSDVLRSLGLFDDGFFLYFEEVELMHRISRAGWEIWHAPASRVMHVGGAATGVNAVATVKRALPEYCFTSRNRYFTLVHGTAAAARATRAWLIGDMVWKLRCLFGLGRAGDDVPNERAMLKQSLATFRPSDVVKAEVNWTDRLGTTPAWMRSQ